MRLPRTLTPIVFILFLLVWPACAHADFQAGKDAYDRKDYSTALNEWLPLAEQGDTLAQHNLGLLYQHGKGVPQDYQEAVRWYRLAADQGYVGAQINLGEMYRKGQGVLQDYGEAMKWYRLAAEQEHAFGQDNLGQMYRLGRAALQGR